MTTCEKSVDGKHKFVRLYPEVPYLGCLHCRQRNTLVKPTPQQAYDLLVSSGVSASDAARRTGHDQPTVLALVVRRRARKQQKHRTLSRARNRR